MDERRISLSVSLPASVHRALVIEAARRSADAGRPIGAAAVAREAMVKALGLPEVRMTVGRPPLAPSTAASTRSAAPAVRHRTRTRPTPQSAA